MTWYFPLSAVVSYIHLFHKVLEDAVLDVLLPLPWLLGHPGQAPLIGHLEVEEQKQRVVADKLGEVRPLLVLR